MMVFSCPQSEQRMMVRVGVFTSECVSLWEYNSSCVCMLVHVFVYIYVHTCVCMLLHMHVWMHVCVLVHMWACWCMCVCKHVWIWWCMYVCRLPCYYLTGTHKPLLAREMSLSYNFQRNPVFPLAKSRQGEDWLSWQPPSWLCSGDGLPSDSASLLRCSKLFNGPTTGCPCSQPEVWPPHSETVWACTRNSFIFTNVELKISLKLLM